MNQYCCKNFPLLARSLNWMTFNNEEAGIIEYCVPYIYHDNQQFRINNCPSCGAKIRGILIKQDEFNKL